MPVCTVSEDTAPCGPSRATVPRDSDGVRFAAQMPRGRMGGGDRAVAAGRSRGQAQGNDNYRVPFGKLRRRSITPAGSAPPSCAPCSQLIRTGSKGLTYGLCSGGCRNGGASWRANWSTPFPARVHGTNIHCRNWRWLQVVPSAEISVTSFSEATGIGKNA